MVVLGGVGKIAGTVAGAMGLGVLNKFLEPVAGEKLLMAFLKSQEGVSKMKFKSIIIFLFLINTLR